MSWSHPESARDCTRDLQATAILEEAMGPALVALTRAPEVCEIMANADGRVWIEELRRGM